MKIYDSAVYHACLVGTNLAYIQHNLPHFQSLLVAEPQQALNGTDLVVVTHSNPEFRQALLSASEGTRVLDLAGVFATEPPKGCEYHAA